ncbi:uncharacterized protein [Epargyreus clarus]|uniref:uncharacterized protein n=1 Tax=Epargyreus clarus TaxID=520877 RepID=UPI003C2D9ECB
MRKRSAAPAASDATSPIMGRKVLLAVVCFLAISKSSADAKINSIKIEDSVGEATSPRLYRKIPDGVYASTSPYAAFSFQIPSFASSPRITHIGPIKQASTLVEKTHGFLKDSYGNKFVGSPQASAYRTAFPQQYVQLQELPAHLAQPLVSAAPTFQYRQVTPHFFGPPQFKVQALQTASPSTANRYAINQPYSFSESFRTLASTPRHHYPTNNKANYADSRETEQHQNQKNVEKSQHVEQIPNAHNKETNGPAPKAQKAIAASASVNKGKKAVINIETKPVVPLLDLTLLEPLTFDNPLVPQVQHFLPRIASVTYQKLPELNVKEIKTQMKEFMIQNTKSYDSGVIEGKPKIYSSKERHPAPRKEKEETTDENDPPRDVPNGEPEILYEIRSPNYKETYQEKVLSYNKQTQTEPVHHSYNEKTEKKPVVYNYVRTSKQPLKVQNVNYDSNDDNPKHLIYNFKPEEIVENKHAENHSPQQNESEDSSDDSGEDKEQSHQRQQNHGQGPERETPHHQEKLEHREQEPKDDVEFVHHNNHQNTPQQSIQAKHPPAENLNPDIEPGITEYEEDIRILPTPKEYDTIKVDPNQHIQHGHVHVNQNSEEPQDRPHNRPHTRPDDSSDESPDDSPRDSPHNLPQSHERSHQPSEEHVHEKSKQIIIKEEIPENGNQNNQELNEEVAENDDKSEEHFEKAYKNAAYGFPSYESNSRDNEKEIYNPETYGKSQYHTDYDVEHTPFQQYQEAGDEYPKSTRSNYKDVRDKTKENYYLDYAINKPKSVENRFRQKENYYKAYMKQKPHYLNDEREGDEKERAKYIAAPAYEYHGSAQKPKQYFAKYQAAPSKVYEYDYSKEAPKDNSAHATRPHQRFKTYTQFVEPQFQYGFEPSALPRLLDSELAAMASNHSPESEKPGMRKKLYKENWYIKQTSTNGRKAAS